MQEPESIAPIDDSLVFDEPIKIRWSGYACSRIAEYNSDFSDDGWDDHFHRPSIYLRTMNRQKTNVVIKTKREAECVRYELNSYGPDRTWVNSSIVRSLERVRSELDDAMAEHGYEPVFERGEGPFAVAMFEGYEAVE